MKNDVSSSMIPEMPNTVPSPHACAVDPARRGKTMRAREPEAANQP